MAKKDCVRKPWFSVKEIVSLSLLGYDSIYRITEVVELPQGRSNVKAFGYRLIKCSDNSILTYGDQELSVFNESLLLKCPEESWLSWSELLHKLNTTDFRLEGEREND